MAESNITMKSDDRMNTDLTKPLNKCVIAEKDAKYLLLMKNATKSQVRNLSNKFERSHDWLCIACRRGLKEAAIQSHVKSEQHCVAVKDSEVDKELVKIVSPSQQHIASLNEFVLDTSQKISAALNGQIAIRQKIAQDVQDLIHTKIPEVSVGLHGSSLSEFAMMSSDVNLSVVVPGCDVHKELPAKVMRTLVDLLEEKKTVYKKVKPDFFAFNKIPRILFDHRESKLKCEVRINVGSPKSMSLLLYCYLRLDVRVLQLGVLFRHWAKTCCVDSQLDGHYPGHIFYIMAIHYLQHRSTPVIPVLHEMFPELLSHGESSEEDSSGGHISELVVKELLDKMKMWRSSNSEPVGLLWHDLFKYYALDFSHEKFGVSILQQALIHRSETQWGSYRLAVQDPNIPRSNVGRAASSDRVFQYLWSSIKKTLVYFNSFKTDTAVQQPEVLSSVGVQSIDLEDACIVYASKVTDSPLMDSSLPTETGPASLGTVQSNQPVPATVVESTDTSEAMADIQEQLQNLVVEDLESRPSSAFPAIEKTFDNVDKILSTKTVLSARSNEVTSTIRFKFELIKEGLVYHPYPVTCLSCKKLNHNILKCPTDDIPNWKLSDLPVPPREALVAISEAFRKYRKSVGPNSENLRCRAEICRMITDILQGTILPEAELELFGSSANGFGTYHSDLDICLKLPYRQLQKMTRSDKNDLIIKIAYEFSRYRGAYFQEVVPITTARVPIVKFYLPDFGQECDVSLCNYLALRNTKMICAYANLDDRAKLLGYAVKHFAKVCDMGDASTGSLSSYAYILMVIHYLQRTDPPVLPCLQKIFPPNYTKITIDGWDCYFFEDISSLYKYWPPKGVDSRNKVNTGQLWLGFLKYFLQFDWTKEVVTIRQLEPLYKFDKWWMGKHMCIEDPFDLDHNLSASIGSKMRTYILERFYEALKFNSMRNIYRNIDDVMNRDVLVGAVHAPKFLLCHTCNRRGHKAEFCPDKKVKKPVKGGSRRFHKFVQSGQALDKHSSFPDDSKTFESASVGQTYQLVNSPANNPVQKSKESSIPPTPIQQQHPQTREPLLTKAFPGDNRVSSNNMMGYSRNVFPPLSIKPTLHSERHHSSVGYHQPSSPTGLAQSSMPLQHSPVGYLQQQPPSSVSFMQRPPSSPAQVQGIPSSAGLVQGPPSSPGLVQGLPSSAGLIQRPPSSPGQTQRIPSSVGLVQGAPPPAGMVQGLPSPVGLVQGAPPPAGLVQRLPSPAGLVQGAPPPASLVQGLPSPAGPVYGLTSPAGLLNRPPLHMPYVQRSQASVGHVQGPQHHPHSPLLPNPHMSPVQVHSRPASAVPVHPLPLSDGRPFQVYRSTPQRSGMPSLPMYPTQPYPTEQTREPQKYYRGNPHP